MSDHQAAQAMKLISALRDQLHKMTAQLAWLERRADNTMSSNLTAEIRFEAETLRRDISEAHRLIDRLRSRYLHGERIQRR